MWYFKGRRKKYKSPYTGKEVDTSVKTTKDITLTPEQINALVPVEANPTLVGNEADLTSLKVGDTKYQIHNILSYGHSTWSDFLRIYNNGNVFVFCRASGGTNPESGNQTRIATLNYIKTSGNDIIGAEFLYYHSVSPHSDSAQGDEVCIYTLRKNNSWSYDVRQAYSKIAAGTNLTSTYNNNVLTLDTNAR